MARLLTLQHSVPPGLCQQHHAKHRGQAAARHAMPVQERRRVPSLRGRRRSDLQVQLRGNRIHWHSLHRRYGISCEPYDKGVDVACQAASTKHMSNRATHILTDINECLDNGGKGPCDQTCSNTIGHFICSCDTGYELNPDNVTCSGVQRCAQLSTAASLKRCTQVNLMRGVALRDIIPSPCLIHMCFAVP